MKHLEDILSEAFIEDPILHDRRWWISKDAALAAMTAARVAAIDECAAKMDEMEAKAKEEQDDDKETYESLHRAQAFHFAARILRGMKT